MSKLSTVDRRRIPRQDFAVKSKAPGSGGYPIEDRSHAQNALARSSGKAVASTVRGAVSKKYPGLIKSDVNKDADGDND
jgi:hypothetical protein